MFATTRSVVAALAFLPILPTLSAQEVVRTVPPGREIRETKLLTLGKTDRWDLTVAAGEMVWCVVESSSFDPVLELVDGAGKVLGRHDGEGTRSELWLRMPAAGPVAFRVQGYQGSGGGHYTFWLQHYRTEAIRPGAAAEHRFGKEQWWHYLVELRAGDVLVPRVTGDGRVTAVFDMHRKGLLAQLGGYRATHDGRYLVRIEGKPDQACRFASALARQRRLPAAGAVRDAVAPHGLDLWRIDLQPGDAWAFHLQMPGVPLDWKFFEPDPPQQEGPPWVRTARIDKGGSRRQWFVVRRSCRLELLIASTSDREGPYQVDFRAAGAALPGGTTLRGELTLGGADVYELTTAPGELIRVEMTSAACDGQLDLWDPEGRILARADDRGPLDRNPSLTSLIVRAGRHRILVASSGGRGGGAYQLRMDRIPVPRLQLGQRLELRLEPGGTRYGHLSLAKGQEVLLSVRGDDVDTAVTVLSPAGRRLGTYEGGGLDGDVLAALRAPAAGRYSLQVHARKGAGVCGIRVIEP